MAPAGVLVPAVSRSVPSPSWLLGCFANVRRQSCLRARPLPSRAAHSGFQADTSFPSSDLSLLGSGVLLFGRVFLCIHRSLLYTAPNSAYNHLSWGPHCNLISDSLSSFSSLCLLHFYSCPEPLNTGHLSKYAALARNPLPTYTNRTSPFSACYLPLSLEAHPLYY